MKVINSQNFTLSLNSLYFKNGDILMDEYYRKPTFEEDNEITQMLNFALDVIEKAEHKKLKKITFGGFVDLIDPCSCGCHTIAEVYSEGKFRCLQCGVLRE